MPSDTQKTRKRRLAKSRKMGRARKRNLAQKGTTPAFPLIPDGWVEPSAAEQVEAGQSTSHSE